jgi:hypothetical protein
MFTPQEFRRFQREQHAHDLRNHFDIVSLHKTERLKHYGLHFAKYVGRLARESAEPKPIERTLVDALLVSLSAANTLHQDLSKEQFDLGTRAPQLDPLRVLADAAGRFADACEKIDHLEEFLPLARTANRDVVSWIMSTAIDRDMNIEPAIQVRRNELASRHFYIED